MTRIIFCSKLKQEAPGLDKPPLPGEIGNRIFNNISKTAWNKWLAHQTLLINENRLSLINPDHKKFLTAEMEKFLFGDGSNAPVGFTPPNRN